MKRLNDPIIHCKQSTGAPGEQNIALLPKLIFFRQLELRAEGELQGTRAVGSAADGSKARVVRVVVGVSEDVTVERVEGFGTELEGDALSDAGALDETKVFFEISEGPVVGLIGGFVAEGVGGGTGDVGVWIAEACGVVPEVGAGDGGVERSISPGAGAQTLAGHEVVPDAVVESRDAGSTAEAERLTALVALDAADGPASDDAVEDAAAPAQEHLSFAEGQVVDVADDEDLWGVLRGDGFFCFEVEWVLDAGGVGATETATDDVAGIGKNLRPGVGGKEVESVVVAALELGGQCVVR